MKKYLVFGVGIPIILAIVAMIGIATIINFVPTWSAKAVDALHGKTVDRLTIEEINASPPQVNLPDHTIIWPRIVARITTANSSYQAMDTPVTLHINDLQFVADSLISGKFRFLAHDFSAEVNQAAPPATDCLAVLQKAALIIPIHLDLLRFSSLKPQIRTILQDLQGLLSDGGTTIPVSFSGTCSFCINKETVTAKLSVSKENGRSRMVMDQESLQVISWILAEKLSQPEIELLSRNPFKAPTLLRIRDEARQTALSAYQKNSEVPEDAYRHILWSFMLTNTYGADFAKSVTDAHEQGKDDNTPAEHKMDYANNSVGQKYAARGYRKDELINRLLHDPEVIRQPGPTALD